MTSIGDWLMLYMLAKNIDQVSFTELVNELKYPDYRFDLDERDSINEELDKLQFQPKNTKKWFVNYYMSSWKCMQRSTLPIHSDPNWSILSNNKYNAENPYKSRGSGYPVDPSV